MPTPLDSLGKGSRDVLLTLKAHGPAEIRTLARRLRVTPEAVRQAVRELEAGGWIARACAPGPGPRPRRGRPPARFALTATGEELFPRAYADLALSLVAAVESTLGGEALLRVLAAITDARVAALEQRVRGLSLERRLAVVREVYRARDEHLSVRRADGGYTIEERNCPFLAVAHARPALCSTTVSTLSRLLGARVVREERFQDGAGRCVFRVDPSVPRPAGAPGFAPEPEPGSTGGRRGA